MIISDVCVSIKAYRVYEPIGTLGKYVKHLYFQRSMTFTRSVTVLLIELQW